MASSVTERLQALLEPYRQQMRAGGHPPELPDRVLALLRDDVPADREVPSKLRRLIDAAAHYWDLHAEVDDPDPLDLEMINDELIDSLYDYYEC